MPKYVIDNLLVAQQQLAYARNRITHDNPAWDDITHAMSAIADATRKVEAHAHNVHSGERGE